ncbi:MAG: hypothetical protein QM737_19185 [Ferruginibacter sp.]
MYKYLVLSLIIILASSVAIAQQGENSTDTFFLAKKTGLLGKLGRSIARNAPTSAPPVKSTEQFEKYNGKIIRFIEVVAVGFNQNLNDTAEIRNNLAIRIANRLHKRTRDITVRKNLFFKEGDVFLPLLVSDNERFLRQQPYLRDAVIVVYKSIMSKDSVDVIVLTRDVFSIGGNFNAAGANRLKSELREENLVGTGSRLTISGLYERHRNPETGFGAEFMERNIKGTFLSGIIGVKSFKNAVLSDRYEENTYYVQLDKPLVSRYTRWTGGFFASYNKSANAYLEKEKFENTSAYRYTNFDLWAGYNVGWKTRKKTDSEKRLRHFVAARGFYNYFDKVPLIFKDSFNYNFANKNGVLFSYSLYKQNFYLTNFIYGFGRNEDIPIGINASITAGWTNIQNRMRGYYGVDFDASTYSPKGFFSSYTARAGAYRGADAWEDISLLLSIDHFTKLRRMSSTWYNRHFISISYARLFKQSLNEPIKLQSDFGLPYFRSDSLNILEFSSRAALKVETVFFNMHRFLGFRFAPFIFTQFFLLQPTVNPNKRSDGYSAFGGGVRARNENLVFGTLELRGFYFPRISAAEMSRWKIVFTSNLRFKYNSSFVNKPDFVGLNY